MRAWANLCTHRTKMTTFSSWVKTSLKICSKMFPECFDKETMKQEQIVLERSTRLNLDPWPHASPYQRGVGSWCQTSDLTNFLALFRPVVMMTMKSLKSWYLPAPEKNVSPKRNGAPLIPIWHPDTITLPSKMFPNTILRTGTSIGCLKIK